MADYRITIGSLTFDGSGIILGSMNIATNVDLPGSELSADMFTVVLDFEAGLHYLFSPADYDGIFTADSYLFGTADVVAGDLTQTPYGTPVNLYDGNRLIAKFYVHEVVRIARTRYKIKAMSAVGFLMNTQHLGGVYSNATVSDIIAEIVAGAFAYEIDQDVADQKVSGWLPIDTARNNLHKLTFALGIAITKDSDGDVVFTFLSDDDPTAVEDDRIYLGGSVAYNTLATAVEVTEHSYYKRPNTQAEQIFSNDGSVTADHLFIPFSEPHYDIQSSGLTIHEAGDNYAIVSGVGTLSGKPYTHDTKVYQQAIPGATGIVPNVVTSDGDTLVNGLNVLSVLKRLASYYGSRKTVNADIILDEEKAGSTITFTDAFGEEATGIIAQLDMSVSSIIKGACKIVTDYTPTGQGNFYHNRALISANGTWTVPEGVTDIRIALIGGGGGGRGGFDGEQGAGGIAQPDWGIEGDLTRYDDEDEGFTSAYYANQPTAQGGAGGEPGIPGKTYVIDKTVTPGEVISVTVGAGGGGGARNGGVGSAGTATTASSTSLGTISSANGTATEAGYFDVLGGESYAAGGVAGYAGMPGGQTDTQSLAGWWGYAGLPGVDFNETWHGGDGGAGVIDHITATWPDGGLRGSGGGGGGAAYGANGGAGGDGYLHEPEEGSTDVYGGDGGAGANAAPPPQAPYGCAGQGGNGGGGGGSAGAGFQYYSSRYSPFGGRFGTGARGPAGEGSVGGRGGDGCVIIYW